MPYSSTVWVTPLELLPKVKLSLIKNICAGEKFSFKGWKLLQSKLTLWQNKIFFHNLWLTIFIYSEFKLKPYYCAYVMVTCCPNTNNRRRKRNLTTQGVAAKVFLTILSHWQFQPDPHPRQSNLWWRWAAFTSLATLRQVSTLPPAPPPRTRKKSTNP